MASTAEPKRIAVFQPEFLEDLSYWVETERRTAKRLLELVKALSIERKRDLNEQEFRALVAKAAAN